MAHSSSPIFFGGGFGASNSVELFFLLSGFYIALILDKSYSTKWKFYKNRILRLFPIYYIILALVLMQVAFIPGIRESHFAFPEKALIFGTISNFTLFGSDWLLFSKYHNGTLSFGSYRHSELPLHQMLFVPQSWSIGIEITFYLLAPLLCKARSRYLVITLTALLLVRFAALKLGLNQDPWTYRFFPFELPLFLIGILIYRLRAQRWVNIKISLFKIYLLLITSYLSFGYLIANYRVNRFWQLLILIILAFIVMMWGEVKPKDKKLGDLSYPIYLSHVLVISTYTGIISVFEKKFYLLEILKKPLFLMPISLSLTILFSYFIVYLVRPFEKMRDKNRTQKSSSEFNLRNYF